MTKKENSISRNILSLAHHDFEKSLLLHAFYKIQNKETSADLVQETFMKTWKYLLKGGEITLMRAFLFHVLNNLIIDEYRKRKNISLDELQKKGHELRTSEHERTLKILDGARVVNLIQYLPKVYEECITLKYLQDLSMDEMSILTGETKNCLTVRLHRGLEKLQFLYLGENKRS